MEVGQDKYRRKASEREREWCQAPAVPIRARRHLLYAGLEGGSGERSAPLTTCGYCRCFMFRHSAIRRLQKATWWVRVSAVAGCFRLAQEQGGCEVPRCLLRVVRSPLCIVCRCSYGVLRLPPSPASPCT